MPLSSSPAQETVSPPAVPEGPDSPELFVVRNTMRGTTLGARVGWAGTSATRRRGLLGRDLLEPATGIYLVPSQWIHTFGMKFSIDVAFLHSSGRVLAIHDGLRPWRLSRMVLRAEGALELPSGTLRRTGTSVGDVLEFLPA